MQMRHRVALDGVQLDGVDGRILISRIEEADGKEDISTVTLYGGSGSRVTSVHRGSLDVTVKFRIKLKKRDMAEREEVIEKVNAWAYAGGWLTVNYKADRRIRVFRAQAAGVGDPWDWTREYSIVFRACGVPYWQKESADSVMRTGVSSASLTLGVSGSEKSALDVEFQNTSGGTVNTFTVATGLSTVAFSSLGLANGETLVIDRSDNGKMCLLRLRIRGSGGSWRSVMDKRTTGSDNDLWIAPGESRVTMSAGGSGKLTVSCHGRYA